MVGTTQTLSYWSLNNNPIKRVVDFSQVTEQVQRGEVPHLVEGLCSFLLSHAVCLPPVTFCSRIPQLSHPSPSQKPSHHDASLFLVPGAVIASLRADPSTVLLPALRLMSFHCFYPASSHSLDLSQLPLSLPTTGLLSRAYKGSPRHHAVSDPVNPNWGAFRF